MGFGCFCRKVLLAEFAPPTRIYMNIHKHKTITNFWLELVKLLIR